MHRFIPSNKNRHTHMLVTRYNWPIEEYLKGHALIVQINHLDDVVNIKKHLDDATKISGFVYRDDYASLETIELKTEYCDSPLYLLINRLGKFRDVFHKIEMLKRMNVVVIFTGSEATAISDAQILASLGIHTGISLKPNSALDDNLLDLITYTFYSPTRHAEIEPFSTIERYYDGEDYVSPTIAAFVNPNRYLHVDKDFRLAFSEEDLASDNIIGTGADFLRSEDLQKAIETKELEWQKMFVESDACTFCPAFRICMGYFKSQRESKRCVQVMSELLEAIEFYKKTKQNSNQELCQL